MINTLVLVLSGFLSAYDQTPTDATLQYRIDSGEVVEAHKYDGYIALKDCSLVGREVTLEVNGMSFFLVVFDCAGEEDGGRAWMEENNIVGEIDYYLWERFGNELVGQYATVYVHPQKDKDKECTKCTIELPNTCTIRTIAYV